MAKITAKLQVTNCKTTVIVTEITGPCQFVYIVFVVVVIQKCLSEKEFFHILELLVALAVFDIAAEHTRSTSGVIS